MGKRECVMFACRNVLPCTTLKGHSFELVQHPFHSSVQLSTHLSKGIHLYPY